MNLFCMLQYTITFYPCNELQRLEKAGLGIGWPRSRGLFQRDTGLKRKRERERKGRWQMEEYGLAIGEY